MDFNQIKKTANSLSKLIDDNEKIALPIFAAKLNKASSIYPEDQTIGVMADITSRMAGGKKLFITRAEIRDLYNRLYSRNTKFAELFQNELGQVEKASASKIYNRENDDEGFDLISKAYDKVVDPTLASALNSAFGNKSNGYSVSVAEDAKELCLARVAAVKSASTVDIVNGNEKFIMCRANFDTPKGKTSVFIPIELTAGKVLFPSIFIGNSGSEAFSKSNLENYISVNAGQKLNIAEKAVFDVIDNAKGANVDNISNVDLAVIKLNAQKETKSDYFSNGVLFQKVAEENNKLVVNTPSYNDKEVGLFAEAFESQAGIAKFKFGENIVKLTRAAVATKLEALGLNNAQISIANSDDTKIVYAVSVNNGRLAFRVPVKIEGKNVLNPTLLISNGAIETFSKEGVNALLKKEATDYKTAAVASALYGLKASELVETVRVAMAEQNLVKAEDALNILSQSGDDKAYQTAFTEYTNGLNNKIAANKNKCSMVVKNASSKHSLCGHTGLPLYKVCQDKNGNCIPEYRKGMEDTNEGAYFMNSKIFF